MMIERLEDGLMNLPISLGYALRAIERMLREIERPLAYVRIARTLLGVIVCVITRTYARERARIPILMFRTEQRTRNCEDY